MPTFGDTVLVTITQFTKTIEKYVIVRVHFTDPSRYQYVEGSERSESPWCPPNSEETDKMDSKQL